MAKKIGQKFKGGEIVEFVSDVGGGKTTFVRGLMQGAGSDDYVSSPTFTISKQYQAGKLNFYHYDFYRLDNAGLMSDELSESLLGDNVVLIEWSGIVKDVLPAEKLEINIKSTGESSRIFEIIDHGNHSHLIEDLK